MLIAGNEPSAELAAAAAKAAAQAAKAEAEKIAAAAITKVKDVFESAQNLGALFKPALQPKVPPPAGLSPAELQDAQQTIALASDSHDAAPVAAWLAAHHDPAAQDQMMDALFRFGPVAGEVLDRTVLLDSGERAALSGALDHAYRSGAVTPDELRAAVVSFGYGAGPGESHEGLGDVVGGTRNPALIGTYARREIELLQAEDGEGARALGVATALGALPPGELQSFLAANPEGVRAAIARLNDDPYAAGSPAPAALLDAAAAIVPATRESVGVFVDAIAQIRENALTRTASAAFFERHADASLPGRGPAARRRAAGVRHPQGPRRRPGEGLGDRRPQGGAEGRLRGAAVPRRHRRAHRLGGARDHLRCGAERGVHQPGGRPRALRGFGPVPGDPWDDGLEGGEGRRTSPSQARTTAARRSSSPCSTSDLDLPRAPWRDRSFPSSSPRRSRAAPRP
jgi:hypothetical protein